MKIQMIRNAPENNDNKTGIGYYADYIESLFEKSKVEYEIVHFELTRKNGIKSLFLENIIFPFFNVCRASRKANVVHATAEFCSVFFPFTKSKKVLTFHHVVRPGEANKTWDIVWHFSTFIAKHFTDEFIAISAQTKDEMVKMLKIPENKITIITHPPKLTVYKKDIEKEDLVMFIGTFCERKRPKLAIDAFNHMLKYEELKNYKMTMCGDGALKQDVNKYIQKCGLDNSIDVVSNISEDRICDLYNRSKILLNTSSLEGLGITTLESQKCSTPVLYFKDANIPPEIMMAAVPCENTKDMAYQALRILTDEKEMENLAKAGINHAESFGKDYLEKMKEVYTKLL